MGIITAIQRFSLNDGPGIRSSIFFKGCNMRCSWCHNPETIALAPQLHFYPSRCINCAACVGVCPTAAHQMTDSRHCFDRLKCVACGRCADVCFSGALDMSGRDLDVSEIMREVMQDEAYYHRSGGGITLTGGEALLQAGFADALLQACSAVGIGTAVETNLFYDFSQIESLLPLIDRVMADIKVIDDTQHRKWTGVSNEIILANIRRLDQAGMPLIIRTPVIPGVNDTIVNIAQTAQFLIGLENLEYYELLNFNPLGHSKYTSLGLENIFSDTRPLPDIQMQKLAQAARQFGLKVKLQ